MKVKLLVSRGGIDFSQQAGETVDVDPETAKRMIEDGQAEPVAEKRSDRAEKRAPNKKP